MKINKIKTETTPTKKLEVKETVIKTPTKTPVKQVKESNTEKITKFDNYKPVKESIEYYEDMSLEEKVEHLNERIRNIESRL